MRTTYTKPTLRKQAALAVIAQLKILSIQKPVDN